MRQIQLAVMAVILGLGSFHCCAAQSVQDVEKALVQLHSAETSNAAYKRLKFLAENDAVTRSYLVKRLPELIPTELSQGKIRQNPGAANLIQLTGELKIAEAVPVLVKALDHDNAQPGGMVTTYSAAELRNDPVAKALSVIGGPAVGPVRDRLKNTGNSQTERLRAFEILYLMNSLDADRALNAQLQIENDPRVKSSLQYGLEEHAKMKNH